MPAEVPVRRPRFLAGVPESSTAVPARFARAARRPDHVAQDGATARGPGEPSGGARPRHERETALPGQPPGDAAAPGERSLATPPAPDLAALRREAMERVAGAVETLRAQADRLGEQARSDAIEIGFQVARRILEAELRQGPEAFFGLVRSALRRAGESRRIAVRVAPEDAELLASDGRGALDGVTAARVECIPDPALQRGDCVVDADFGQVDGRLGTRLAELRRAVDAATEGAA